MVLWLNKRSGSNYKRGIAGAEGHRLKLFQKKKNHNIWVGSFLLVIVAYHFF